MFMHTVLNTLYSKEVISMVHFKIRDPELGFSYWCPNNDQAKAILSRDYCLAMILGVSHDLYMDAIKSPTYII